jgi:hypothetical protein
VNDRIIQLLLVVLVILLTIEISINRPPQYQIISNEGAIWRLDLRTGTVQMFVPDGKGGSLWIVPTR